MVHGLKKEMKIAEIVKTPSHEEPMKKYLIWFYEGYTVINTLNGKELRLATDMECESYGLFEVNPDRLVAYMNLCETKNGWQIAQTATDLSVSGKGLIRYIITNAIARHKFILSDNRQSPEAIGMWTKLIKMPGDLTISVLNTKTKKKLPVKYDGNGQIINSPWDESLDTVLVAENRKYSKDDQLIIEQANKFYERIGRKIVWFDNNPPPGDWSNP